MRRIGDAAAVCMRVGELRLATLIGQAGNGASADVRAQIELWTRQARFAQFADVRQRIYRLLAGDVRAVCAAIAESHSWRVALALHSWYAPLERDSVAAALTAYETSVNAGAAAHPWPEWTNTAADDDKHKVFDTAYLLVRLYVHRTTSLATVCDPRTHCRKGLDHSTSWCLHWTLTTLGYPPIARVGELSSALARQLDTDDSWQWGVYALLCVPPASDEPQVRRERVLDLLGRRAAHLLPRNGKLYTFLRDDLLVPPQWLETAVAWHARATNDARRLPHALLLAGEWQALHDSVLRDVAPRAILSSSVDAGESLASLRVLLDALHEHRDAVGGWSTGGAVLHEFVTAERDIAQLRQRFTVAPIADLRRLGELLTRLHALAVGIGSLAFGDADAAPTLTKTVVAVDGAHRSAIDAATERRRSEADACRAELSARATRLLLTVRAMTASEQRGTASDAMLAVCPTLLTMPLPEDFRLQTCATLLLSANEMITSA